MVKQTFLGKFMDGLSYMRSNDQITPRVMGGGEFLNFTNAFSSNLNFTATIVGYSLEDKAPTIP